MMKQERGQLSIFIVISMIILLLAIAALFLPQGQGPSKEMPATPMQIASPEEAQQVKSFIQTCVEKTALESVIAFGSFGGESSNNFFPPLIELGGYAIPVYYDSGKVNLPTNQMIANEVLSEYLNNHLEECLAGFESFQNIEIQPGRPIPTKLTFLAPLLPEISTNGISTAVTIQAEDVRFSVDYPVIIEKSNQQTLLNSPYNAVIKVPLGQMIELSRRVIESHIAHPSLVDWPDIYATNHAGLYNFTYFFPIYAGEQLPNTVVYQLIANNAQIDNNKFRMLFGARYTP